MIELYFTGVILTAAWMFADDFERFTALALDLHFKPKYHLIDYAWRPFIFPYLLVKWLFSLSKN